jgi:hypothetical protein
MSVARLKLTPANKYKLLENTMNDHLTASITLQPTVTVGQVTTVAEKILEALFKNYEAVLESENPVNDKKTFFRMRASTVRMLVQPIKIVRESKAPLGLKFDYSVDEGTLRMSAASVRELPPRETP